MAEKHKYGSAADVAQRIREWLGKYAQENTASLLLYEALRALERAQPAGEAIDWEHLYNEMAKRYADASCEIARLSLLVANHASPLAPTDAQVIAQAEKAGFKWLPPDDDEGGFPGGFDMSCIGNMRALLSAQPPAAAEAERDAERYRWLLTDDNRDVVINTLITGDASELNAAIDAELERPTQAPEKNDE